MKDRPGVLLKNQTPWSKQNPLSSALKERHAKTRFQIPHLLRNTWLGNAKPVGRPAKTSRFRNREKIAEVANVQRLRHGEKNNVRAACHMQSRSRRNVCHSRPRLYAKITISFSWTTQALLDGKKTV